MSSPEVLDSMMASRSLDALFLSSRTRSILVMPRGLMSLRMRAVMMPNPLDSCMAMQTWFS